MKRFAWWPLAGIAIFLVALRIRVLLENDDAGFVLADFRELPQLLAAWSSLAYSLAPDLLVVGLCAGLSQVGWPARWVARALVGTLLALNLCGTLFYIHFHTYFRQFQMTDVPWLALRDMVASFVSARVGAVLSVAALLAVRFDGRAFTASRALRRTEQVGLVALGLACLWMSWHVLAHPTAAPINAQSPVALAMFSREPAERELPAGTPTPADWGPPGDFTPQWKPIEKISRRFNVILMVMESVRDDVVWPSPTAVPMPRLAALAPNAAVFTRAYAHAPRSRKALEALMFGVYPTTSWRGQKVVKEGFGLESLPEAWKKAGLRTAFLTPWETGFDRFGDVVANRGFETVLDSGTLGGPDDGALVPALDRFLEKSSAPFGAILWTRQTHGPYKLPPPKVNRSPLNTFEAYRETIEYTDGVIGDLVDMLKRRGRWEDTVLILVGDHGQSFDEHFDSGHGHGRRVYETSSRVPLLFINPVLFHGERDDRVVEQMDVCATAAWLAGDERRQFNVGSVVFLQKPSATAYLLNTFDGFAGGVVVNELKYSYGAGEDNQPAVERLFDVVADPGELHDLSAQRRPEAEALKRRFFGWYSTWQGRWEGVSYLPQNSGSSAVRETLLGSAR